ncbi:MAG: CBS domain-containing protein [Bdellovibrionota bacterium]
MREIVDSEELKKPISSVMKTDFQFTCPNQNLYQAFVIISAGDFDYLPVVENAESKKLLGKLSRHRVLQVYKNQLTTRGIIEQSEVSGHKV